MCGKLQRLQVQLLTNQQHVNQLLLTEIAQSILQKCYHPYKFHRSCISLSVVFSTIESIAFYDAAFTDINCIDSREREREREKIVFRKKIEWVVAVALVFFKLRQL